jgi:predicted site-specific integrase-resolvase
MSNINYVTTKIACSTLNICRTTLRKYAEEGKIDNIRTEGNHRLYNLKKYIEDNNLTHLIKEDKKNIIYCRVSSHDRKKDLERQIEYLKSIYPEHILITDIGSGINFKRKGLQEIINLAIENKLNEVVVTYKDRLCRIGYDLIEHILTTYSNAKIKIIKKNIENSIEEITNDLIEIVTVYSSKIHGKRSNRIP